jgi:hydrogenase expression/formation protein HypE
LFKNFKDKCIPEENSTMNNITMAHGAGGTIMNNLIRNRILKFLGGSNFEVPLEAFDDSAVVDNIVLKSDSHAVKPLFFPGGDIGRLAIAGTVNDIAMLGAQPLALTCGLVLEEGFPLKDLDRILFSMKTTCNEAGVFVVTGDTKVVEKSGFGGCIINTSGIGKRCEELEYNIAQIRKYRSSDSRWILDSNLRNGDKIIVSGTLGDHGITILSAQEGYNFGSKIQSDITPMNKVILNLLKVGGIVAMKDPTRGGLSNSLNEWNQKSEVGIFVKESKIPVRNDVKIACEMLGLDPFEIGNEGKVLLGVIPQKVEEVLETLKKTKEGKNAQIIGEVTTEFNEVILETIVGGKRIMPPPVGDPIPRIC